MGLMVEQVLLGWTSATFRAYLGVMHKMGLISLAKPQVEGSNGSTYSWFRLEHTLVHRILGHTDWSWGKFQGKHPEISIDFHRFPSFSSCGSDGSNLFCPFILSPASDPQDRIGSQEVAQHLGTGLMLPGGVVQPHIYRDHYREIILILPSYITIGKFTIGKWLDITIYYYRIYRIYREITWHDLFFFKGWDELTKVNHSTFLLIGWWGWWSEE